MSGNQIKFKPGAYIFIEGDEDSCRIFIVKKGTISLLRSNLKLKNARSHAKTGDIIGFISSMCSRPRMESAVAETDSVLVEFTKDSFLALLHKNNQIALKIIGNLADELSIYNELILYHNKTKDILPPGTRLFNLGKHYFNVEKTNMSYYILKKHLDLYPDATNKDETDKMLQFMENSVNNSVLDPVIDNNNKVYSDKQLIFCEHEPGEELYIIKNGKVKIVKSQKNSELILSILKEGDIFGELSIISNKPRNATAISYGNSTLSPVNRDTMILLMNKSPGLVNKIFISLCQRIWFTFIRMEAKLYNRAITRIYAFIENKLMEENISLKSSTNHTFNFGIEELFEMLELNQEKHSDTMDELLEDDNLHFNFGQIKITDSFKLSSKAKFYRTRDNIDTSKKEKPVDDLIESEFLIEDEEKANEPQKRKGITPVAGKIYEIKPGKET